MDNIIRFLLVFMVILLLLPPKTQNYNCYCFHRGEQGTFEIHFCRILAHPFAPYIHDLKEGANKHCTHLSVVCLLPSQQVPLGTYVSRQAVHLLPRGSGCVSCVHIIRYGKKLLVRHSCTSLEIDACTPVLLRETHRSSWLTYRRHPVIENRGKQVNKKQG